MKRLIVYSLFVVVLAVVVIPITVQLLIFKPKTVRQVTEDPEPKPVYIPLNLYVKDTGQTITLDLEEYVKGVVAAEMPADFAEEALKAQAVAARTFAVKHMPRFGGSGDTDHPGADLTTDYQTGQAWLAENQLKNKWGQDKFNQYWSKITNAVTKTSGLIAVFNNEPIDALFHSTCGGHTASAKELWGNDVPYLKGVVCSWDQKSPRYSETKSYTFLELEEILGKDVGVVTAAQSGDSQIAKIIDYTESGRVNQIRIGSKMLSGVVLRNKLALRSTNFVVDRKEEKVTFKTTGYGHGVGMCQYGANGMAKEGAGFRRILEYYYTGIAVRPLQEIKM